MKVVILLVAGILAFGAYAPSGMAASPDGVGDTLQSLHDAVQRERYKGLGEQPSLANQEQMNRRDGVLNALENLIQQGDSPQLIETLRQLPMDPDLATINKLVAQLTNAVAARNAAREKEMTDRINKEIADAVNAIVTGTAPKDMDQSISDLGVELQSTDRNDSPALQQLYQKHNATRQFVLDWQDYLGNIEAGNNAEALQELRNLVNQNSNVIPRSQLLEKMNSISGLMTKDQAKGNQNPAPAIADIMKKTGDLDSIPEAIAELTNLESNTNQNDPRIHNTIEAYKNELSAINESYTDFKAGIPASLKIRMQENSFAFEGTRGLAEKLVAMEAPRVLGRENEPLQQGETVQAYLARITNEAAQSLDVETVLKARQLSGLLDGRSAAADPTSPPFNVLIAARNQEAAHQYAPAIISYEMALKLNSDLVTATAIGARIDAIKAAHPDDYDEGYHLFLNNEATFQPQGGVIRSGQMQRAPQLVRSPGSILGQPGRTQPSNPLPQGYPR